MRTSRSAVAGEPRRAQRPDQVGGGQRSSPDRRPSARIVISGREEFGVPGAGPDFRRPLGAAAARRAVEHRRRRALIQEHLAGRRRCRPLGCQRRRPQHLAVRLVAQVEAVGAVTAEIGHGVGPHRDGERLERRRHTLASRLPGEHAGDVVVDRDGPHRVPARAGDTDAQRRLSTPEAAPPTTAWKNPSSCRPSGLPCRADLKVCTTSERIPRLEPARPLHVPDARSPAPRRSKEPRRSTRQTLSHQLQEGRGGVPDPRQVRRQLMLGITGSADSPDGSGT